MHDSGESSEGYDSESYSDGSDEEDSGGTESREYWLTVQSAETTKSLKTFLPPSPRPPLSRAATLTRSGGLIFSRQFKDSESVHAQKSELKACLIGP